MKAIPIEELMATEGIKLSDEFYPAAEVDAYRAKVRALVEAAAELVGAGQSHIESTRFCVIYERAAKVRAALAALEDEDD